MCFRSLWKLCQLLREFKIKVDLFLEAIKLHNLVLLLCLPITNTSSLKRKPSNPKGSQHRLVGVICINPIVSGLELVLSLLFNLLCFLLLSFCFCVFVSLLPGPVCSPVADLITLGSA